MQGRPRAPRAPGAVDGREGASREGLTGAPRALGWSAPFPAPLGRVEHLRPGKIVEFGGVRFLFGH